MNAKILLTACEEMANLIKKTGRMSLDDVKKQYKKKYNQVPLTKESDEHIHTLILGYDGAKFDADNGEYYFEHTMTKKRKSIDFSPTYASTSKRSRSAPDKENKENYDIERPVRPQAKPKRNSHKDPHEAKENPPRKSRYTNHQNNESSETGTPKSSRSKSEHLNDLTQFQNCVLVGDDFLLGFAMLELKENVNRNNGLLQSGLCVSGMTISAATHKLRGVRNQKFERILIYLGSFDIINGKQLIELMNDFDELVGVCKRKGLKAVACTLAPLPFYENGNRQETLIGFNKYLKTLSKLSTIDVHKAFLSSNDFYNERCYGEKMRKVSGSTQWVKLWSDFGRYQFKETVMRNLGMALLDDKPACHGK